jgi:hypothetical protein
MTATVGAPRFPESLDPSYGNATSLPERVERWPES